MKSLPVLLDEFYSARDETDQVRFLFEHFDDWIQGDQFYKIDEFLKEVDVTKAADAPLVGLVRVPFLARRRLKEWKPMLEKVAAELEKRQHNSKKLLAGLFE